MKAQVLLLALVGALTACSERSTGPSRAASAVRADVLTTPPGTVSLDTNVIVTPVGVLPKECVHYTPNNEIADEKGVVIRPDGSQYSIPICTQRIANPILPNRGPRSWSALGLTRGT